MIDNGIHCYYKCRRNVSPKSQKISGLSGKSCRKILGSDESGESSQVAGAKGGGNFPKVTSMKTVHHIKLDFQLFQLIIPVMLLLFLAGAAGAQVLPPGWKGGPTNTPLDSWSFQDSTNWTSDLGYAPISFTNLSFSHLGNGDSLVVDTNIPGLVAIQRL